MRTDSLCVTNGPQVTSSHIASDLLPRLIEQDVELKNMIFQKSSGSCVREKVMLFEEIQVMLFSDLSEILRYLKYGHGELARSISKTNICFGFNGYVNNRSKSKTIGTTGSKFQLENE